jgi:trans-2,3-dihydro-3-hydroxyanthranilate isomerase
MKRRFVVCNVFTQDSFGGNPLAVVLDADGLSTEEMQAIARQFNYSETTFVLPPREHGDNEVRIFTPSTEVPFAGHPNIGTAFVLSRKASLAIPKTFRFEEKAGEVPVKAERRDDGVFTELVAPEPLQLGETYSAELLAPVLSLNAADFNVSVHPPQVASVGLPFVLIELNSLDALQRARINTAELDKLVADIEHPFLHLYVRSEGEFDIHTRMFAPTDGVPEDPATGSANCALAATLAHFHSEEAAELKLKIAQGVEMGRPSQLYTQVRKNNGQVTEVRVGGYSVLFSEGEFDL